MGNYFNQMNNRTAAKTLVESYTDVRTMRMNAANPNKQKRLKLYMPMTKAMEDDIQIMIVFVNDGCTHCDLIVYLEQMLGIKVNALCIADDDGDFDEDFPPIGINQDITDLGVEHFWIERKWEIGNNNNERIRA